MTEGQISSMNTLLGFMLIGFSYKKIIFTPENKTLGKKNIMTTRQKKFGYYCEACELTIISANRVRFS